MNVNDDKPKVSSWDDTFMDIAHVIKKRSKDPSTQVGACIVGSDNRILSVGYNGAPNGFDDNVFKWGKNDVDELNNKYPYVVHAERNAVLNFRGILRDLNNSTVYVTLFPCNECAKELAQVGVKEVVFNKYPRKIDTISFKSALIIFQEVGIKIRQL